MDVNPALQSAMYACLSKTAGCPITINSSLAANNVTRVNTTVSNSVAGTLVPGLGGVQSFVQQESRKTVGG